MRVALVASAATAPGTIATLDVFCDYAACRDVRFKTEN
jgi:hypothetical protein